MSEETCPACGEPLGAKHNKRGALEAVRHEVDGPSCRLEAWSQEVARRGWVRVVGRVAAYLYERNLVQYGPFWLTAEQEMRDAELFHAEGARDARVGNAPKRTNSAFAPRWAFEVCRALGMLDAPGKRESVFTFVRGDDDLQRTIEAAAMLAESASDARKAVAAVVRSAMQEVKGGVGSKIVDEDGGDCD